MSGLAGTDTLVRLIVRRDRWLLPLWILLIAAYPVLGVSFTQGSEPTAAIRQAYVDQIAGNPGFLMLYGPAFGSSVGALASWRTGDVLWGVALASLITVIRHTRADEEAGRRELLGSTVVGRQAPLAAAVVVALAANLVLAALTALGMVAQGLPAGGSAALGLRIAAVGALFAGVSAVTAQLTETATAARALAVTVLGAAFLVRAAGDAGGEASWLAWLSPIGWAQRVRPYAGERWWVLVLAAGTAGALAATALVLSARRDAGAGLLHPRRGPSSASPMLGSPLALAWRLHRGALLSWAIGLAVFSAVLASSAKEAGSLFANNPGLKVIFGGLGGRAEASDLFLSGVLTFLGIFVGAYAVQATNRLHHEEVALQAEPVLATSVSRLRWVSSHVIVALLGPTVVLAVVGSAGGLVYGLSVGDVGRELPRVLAGALVQLPAVWVLVGVATALFGFVPRFTPGGWAAFGVVVFFGQIGVMLGLSQPWLNVSPFTHIPKLLGGPMTPTPLIWLTAIAVGLVAAGLVGFHRRDIGRT